MVLDIVITHCGHACVRKHCCC